MCARDSGIPRVPVSQYNRREKETVYRERTGPDFSAASVWGLELKAAKGELRLPRHWLDAAADTGFLHLNITPLHACQSVRLPWHHNDPFDRLLIAQVRELHLQIVTRDAVIGTNGVSILAV